MFPAARFKIQGLDPKKNYMIFLDFVPFDDNRYKFYQNKWLIVDKALPQPNRN